MADKNSSDVNTTTNTNNNNNTPIVTHDPRFKAGRSLVQKGLAQEGAIEIFATLVEEASTKYGESSIETAPAYYEYGNALVRAASRALAAEQQVEEEEEAVESAADARAAAAAAAEERLKGKLKQEENNVKNEEDDGDSKPAAKTNDDPVKEEDNENSAGDDQDSSNNNIKEEDEQGDDNDDENTGEENDGEDDNDANNDLNLALEMMENSFSILEEYRDSSTKDDSTEKPYSKWVQDELPRVLLGIGDTLAALGRHADAADAYSRVLEYRQEQLQAYIDDKESSMSVEQLQAHRRVCEATVLIAEELLACPSDQDVVTTETKSLIVTAQERVEYARGYYDKARDALQETVFYMGKLASRNVDLGGEKEDVCFIATMVMGVGETLAAIDEEAAAAAADNAEPAKKKAKI